MKKATLNIQLLNLIRERAEKEPESLNMMFWTVKHPICGTVGCLAGNAYLLKDRYREMLLNVIQVSDEEVALLAGKAVDKLDWFEKTAKIGQAHLDGIAGARLIFTQGEPLIDHHYPPGLTPRSLLMVGGWPLRFQQAFDHDRVSNKQVTIDRLESFTTSWLASGWPFINSLGELITPNAIPA